jgi:hypothetical protein
MEEIFKMKKFINKTNKGYYNARIAEIKEKISDDNVDAMTLLDTLADELTKDAQKTTASMWGTFVGQDPTQSFIVVAKNEKEAQELTRKYLGITENGEQVDIVVVQIKETVVPRSELIPQKQFK